MRIIPVILLLLFVHFGTLTQGQKPVVTTVPSPVTTSPPPPPPPPPPPGFQLLKVQIVGDYKLGITRAEYDSLAKQEFSIKTANTNYNLMQWPSFSSNKLTSLQFSTYSEDSTSFKDVLALYEERLGEPAHKFNKDTIIAFPSQLDTLLNGEYQVKETMLTWNYRYYDLVIYTIRFDMNNNTKKSSLRIVYRGNEKYIEVLQNAGRKADD